MFEELAFLNLLGVPEFAFKNGHFLYRWFFLVLGPNVTIFY